MIIWSVISSFFTLSEYVLLSCNFCLLPRVPDFARAALAFLPSVWAPVFPVASPGDSRSLLTKAVVFCLSGHLPAARAQPDQGCGGRRDARGTLGSAVFTAPAAVAAAHCLRTPAIYITCLQNVMDVPVIDVGHARCVVTALLYKSLVTSVQTVQIV